MDVVFLLASFAVILAGALLFTNAIEWAGNRLGLGEGATGSVLAAVGTAMPETLIPIVALIGGGAGSEDVAIGAIIGAPFLLATIAMALVGISALLFQGRREQGTRLAAHVPTLDRDLIFFGVFFAIGIGAGLGLPDGLQVPLAIVFAVAYVFYVRQTLRGRRRPAAGGDDRPPVPGSDPRGRTNELRDRAPARHRARGDRRGRPPVRRGADHGRGGRRHRAAGALAGAGAAGDRAAGEGEQLLLGPRGQGQPRARQHHRGDGLPVDDPDRVRARAHRMGPGPLRRRLRGPRPHRRGDRLLALRRRGRFEALPIVAWAGLFVAFIGYVALG